MAEARSRLEWCQTARLANLLYNAHRGPDSDPTTEHDWNPHPPPERPGNDNGAIPVDNVESLKLFLPTDPAPIA